MTTLVMSVEGVLNDHPATDTMLNYEATVVGRTLYNLLKPTTRIILLSSDPYSDRVKQWLMRERFTGYAATYSYPLDSLLTPAQWKVSKVEDLLGLGHHIGFYLDTDPQSVQDVLALGVSALLMATPSSYVGEGSDSLKYQPWYSLVAKVQEQNMARAAKAMEDERGQAEESHTH